MGKVLKFGKDTGGAGKKIDGVKEALELLSAMPFGERDKLLVEMAKKDPRLTEYLKENLVTFTDLQYLDSHMFQSLLKDVKINELGPALRGAPKELIQHVLSNVSQMMAQEIVDILNGPKQKLSDVEKARQKIVEVVKEKIQKGEIMIRKEADSDEYV